MKKEFTCQDVHQLLEDRGADMSKYDIYELAMMYLHLYECPDDCESKISDLIRTDENLNSNTIHEKS